MSLTKEVLEFVADADGCDVSELSTETELWEQLRIGGDDLEEFFLAFQRRFGVDLDGFDAAKYSPWEVEVPVVIGWNRVARLFHLPKATYAPLKIADLIAAAEAKSWSKRK